MILLYKIEISPKFDYLADIEGK